MIFAIGSIVFIPLIVAAIAGFMIALLQAITQIQDQTLPQTAKLAAVGFVLVVFGGFLMRPLMALTIQIFSNLHLLVP